MPYLPPFADPTAIGARIMGGINYASAGGGILDETGRHWVIPVDINFFISAWHY